MVSSLPVFVIPPPVLAMFPLTVQLVIVSVSRVAMPRSRVQVRGSKTMRLALMLNLMPLP